MIWEAHTDSAELQKKLQISREDAEALGHATVAILKDGYYVTPTGTRVDIRDPVADAVVGTASYPPEVDPPARSRQQGAMTVEVQNMTTLAGVTALQAQGFDPAALNFASATSPGGGFLSGSLAQEEYLARSSALWACLRGNPMYAYHRARKDPFYSDYVIYSPHVPVIRDDDGVLLEAPYRCAIITSPAVHARGVRRTCLTAWGKLPRSCGRGS